MKMEPALQAKWCAALRSGQYKQATGALKTAEGYCCLGVLLMVADGDDVYHTPSPYSRCGTLIGGSAQPFIDMNDKQHLLFNEIADYIEGSR